MESGKKDEPIYWEAPTTENDGGVVVTTWADAYGFSPPESDWAEIISQKGKEAFEAGRTQTTRLVRICVGFRESIVATWRFKWMDEYYEIIDIDRSQRRYGDLWITARLVDAT